MGLLRCDGFPQLLGLHSNLVAKTEIILSVLLALVYEELPASI